MNSSDQLEEVRISDETLLYVLYVLNVAVYFILTSSRGVYRCI